MEIFYFLKRSFRENERFIMKESWRQVGTEPENFIPMHKKITNINEGLIHFFTNSIVNIYYLDTKYRKIAETVMNYFNTEIIELRERENARIL